ncbi:dTDP-4-dehydrorhamnose 3,5-epimerase [Phenylobacterium sp.]|uniref:dTDP-4-dehydrorhamnose 3,5-epimerase n=1 Tax=Phenylobacterium sp. TaxID=1871053 RepID=UPI00301B9544
MRFVPTPIAGVVRVEADPHADDRGLFARLHCPEEFAAAGLDFVPVQTSVSRNPTAGTLRGLHYQAAPHAETKLVRVTQGRVFDVAVDLRRDSPTYRGWTGVELSADNLAALFIPEGVAHGFLTLEPDTDVLYQIAPAYRPGHEAGVRWDDPAFGVAWPMRPQLISPRDAGYPDYDAED